MKFDSVISGKIVTDKVFEGEIGVKNGKIMAIKDESGSMNGEKYYDCEGQYIFPGFIDSHVHCFSNPDEGIEKTTKAAAHGGITTIFDMPYDRPYPINHIDLFKQKTEQVNKYAYVDMGLWGTIAKCKGTEQITKMAEYGAIGIKLSTFETDVERFPRIPDIQIKQAMELAKNAGILVGFHAESEEIIKSKISEFKEKGLTKAIYHNLSRPPESESLAVIKLIELAYWTNSKIHLVHISHPHTVELIESFRKAYNVDVTFETCYQYTTLSTEDLKKYGSIAKCNPPLRTPDEVKCLTNQVLNNRIEFITSDHAPWVKDLNETNIFNSPSGLTGLDIMIPVMFDRFINKGLLSIIQFKNMFSTNIARRFGIKNKGIIKEGYDADLTVIDPKKTWQLDETCYESISNQSVFNREFLQGKVTKTFLRGTLIYDGEVKNKKMGQYIKGPGFKEEMLFEN